MRILDIDNCISDDSWRIEIIGAVPPGCDSRDRYHTYNSLSLFDQLRNEDLLVDPICFLTARPILYRSITDEWLRRNGITYRHLLMRNDTDWRSSVDVKRDQVAWLINHYDVDPGAISCAYDDKLEVVAMYRKCFGIKAEVRAIHDIPYPKFKEM